MTTSSLVLLVTVLSSTANMETSSTRLEVPSTCHIDSRTFQPVYEVLCDSDIVCARNILKVVCK